MDGYSLADVASVAGNGMGEGMWIVLLIVLLFGGGFNRGDYGQYATSASQQEILFGQQFQNIDNKIDRLANGLCDSTYALNNVITGEGRALQTQLSNDTASINATTVAQTQKILDAISTNKINELQAQVSELKTQNMFCGVPKISPYMYNVVPSCGCNCGNV